MLDAQAGQEGATAAAGIGTDTAEKGMTERGLAVRTRGKPIAPPRAKRTFLWLEEFKTCSCTNLVKIKGDAIGYCPKHGTDRKYLTKVPITGKETLGYAG